MSRQPRSTRTGMPARWKRLVGLALALGTVALALGEGPMVLAQMGGATSGPKNWTFDFANNQKQSYVVQFRGDGPAKFKIEGSDADAANMEVRVYDNITGQLVTQSTEGISWKRDVTWYVSSRSYRIEVWNVDQKKYNFVKMQHN